MGYIGKVAAGGATHLIGSTLYGTCATLADIPEKTVSCSDFTTLFTGVTIHVKFTNSNTASEPMLNVNNTGAKLIKEHGIYAPINIASICGWTSGQVISFTYDGTYWQMNDSSLVDRFSAFVLASPQTLSSIQQAIIQENIGLTRLMVSNVTLAANSWIQDSTYADYPYRAAITVTGATPSLVPEVIFSPNDAISGNYAPVATTGIDTVYIYAKQEGAVEITIPTVLVH